MAGKRAPTVRTLEESWWLRERHRGHADGGSPRQTDRTGCDLGLGSTSAAGRTVSAFTPSAHERDCLQNRVFADVTNVRPRESRGPSKGRETWTQRPGVEEAGYRGARTRQQLQEVERDAPGERRKTRCCCREPSCAASIVCPPQEQRQVAPSSAEGPLGRPCAADTVGTQPKTHGDTFVR